MSYRRRATEPHIAQGAYSIPVNELRITELTETSTNMLSTK